jgi:hypothetical protein
MIYETILGLAVKSGNYRTILAVWKSILATNDIELIKSTNTMYGKDVMSSAFKAKELNDIGDEKVYEPHVLLAMILNEMGAK